MDKELILKEYKTFVNWKIKGQILEAVCIILKKDNIKNIILLDLGSGRGNDLNRWIINKISYVIGIDSDKSQLQIAINRYKYRKQDTLESKNIKVRYVLGSSDDDELIKENLIISGKSVFPNIITSNFSINQMPDLEHFISTVSKNSKPGTYFIGTATDGDILKEIFKKNKTINENLYKIEKLTKTSYKFSINTPYFKSDDGEYTPIVENFIYKEEFLSLCLKYGFSPVSVIKGLSPIFNFSEITEKYETEFKELAILYFGFTLIKL